MPRSALYKSCLKWAVARNVEKCVGKRFYIMLCYFHLSGPNTSSLWGVFECPDWIVGLQTKP